MLPIKRQRKADEDFISNVQLNWTLGELLRDKPAMPDHTPCCSHNHKSIAPKTAQHILYLTVVAIVTPFLNSLKYGSQLWREEQLVRQNGLLKLN